MPGYGRSQPSDRLHRRRRARAWPGPAAHRRPAGRRSGPGPSGEPRRPFPRRLPGPIRAPSPHAALARQQSPRRLSLPDLLIEPIVLASLAEDLGRAGDVTSAACIPAEARLAAAFVARQSGVVAGLACARLAVTALDPAAQFEAVVADGASVAAGQVLARVEANARALL